MNSLHTEGAPEVELTAVTETSSKVTTEGFFDKETVAVSSQEVTSVEVAKCELPGAKLTSVLDEEVTEGSRRQRGS